MTYASVGEARASLLEFVPHLRRAHSLVILPSGRVCRVLGTPGDTGMITVRHVRGNLWRATHTSWGAISCAT